MTPSDASVLQAAEAMCATADRGPADQGPFGQGEQGGQRAPVSRPARARIVRRPVHGVLLLDKPLGLSSNDALQIARRLLRAEKGGHTGTLDPMATGLLPLCFGAATKFSQVSLEADKRYRATLKLGRTTTTGDAEGEVLQECPVPAFSDADIEVALAPLRGAIEQVPPMHSALKRDGKALYEYARAGQTVERAARAITVHALTAVSLQGDQLVIDVHCSKGTYVRTLAEDIGAALGCGAHLIALRRTASGPLHVGSAVTLDALRAMSEPQREALLLPMDRLLADWPLHRLDAAESARFITGLRRRVAAPDAQAVRVYGPPLAAEPGRVPPELFLGAAHIRAGELIPTRLLSPTELQPPTADAVVARAS